MRSSPRAPAFLGPVEVPPADRRPCPRMRLFLSADYSVQVMLIVTRDLWATNSQMPTKYYLKLQENCWMVGYFLMQIVKNGTLHVCTESVRTNLSEVEVGMISPNSTIFK